MRLTPVTDFGGWWAKREDTTGGIKSPGGRFYDVWPAGSKVRQYAAMAKAAPGAPMIVGCSANSAMQIYVAAAAHHAGVKAIIYTAKRAKRSDATNYAINLGAEVNETPKGAYLNVLRSYAKQRAAQYPKVVRWDAEQALVDASEQCKNLPKEAKRIVIPTGSGLTCAGVLIGMAHYGLRMPVVAVAVSGMADRASIVAMAKQYTMIPLPKFSVVTLEAKYDAWEAEILPDGTPLDPYYAAKAYAKVKRGDCFWIPGLRPLSAMPAPCVELIRRMQSK